MIKGRGGDSLFLFAEMLSKKYHRNWQNGQMLKWSLQGVQNLDDQIYRGMSHSQPHWSRS